MMATNTTKWLVGCGIGCVTVIIIAGVIVGGGFLCVKSAVNTIQETEQSQKELQRQYGGLAEYVPALDGSIAPSRMEAFLAVRARLAEMHPDLVQTFESLPHEGFRHRAPSVREVVKLVKTASGVLPLIADYIQTRNQALMNEEMGFGEYFYIYTIAYHSWLGYSPCDGPESVRESHSGSHTEIFDEDSSFDRKTALERYNDFVVRLLRNQRDAMPVTAKHPNNDLWKQRLEREIQLLEDDQERVPWQDGLPKSIEASLRPYAADLEGTYCRACNVFDMFSSEHGDWDYSIGND